MRGVPDGRAGLLDRGPRRGESGLRGPLTLLALLWLILGVPCHAQKVRVDFDRDYDFSAVETYGWVDPVEREEDPLLHQRLVAAVDYHLTMLGARKVERDPDVWVTYHSDSREEVTISTNTFGYGYGEGWYWADTADTGRSLTTEQRYRVGTLIVDVWTAEEKRLVWRGTGWDTVPANPDKIERRINKAVAQMFEKWEKMMKKVKPE